MFASVSLSGSFHSERQTAQCGMRVWSPGRGAQFGSWSSTHCGAAPLLLDDALCAALSRMSSTCGQRKPGYDTGGP